MEASLQWKVAKHGSVTMLVDCRRAATQSLRAVQLITHIPRRRHGPRAATGAPKPIIGTIVGTLTTSIIGTVLPKLINHPLEETMGTDGLSAGVGQAGGRWPRNATTLTTKTPRLT